MADGRSAAAGEPGDALRIDYQAPVGCPDADDFRRQLRDRSRVLRSGEPVAADESLAATVVAGGGSFRGSLVLRSGDQVVGTREVESESCKDVVAALALAAAIDVDARVAPPPPPPPPLSPQPTAHIHEGPPPAPRSWILGAGVHAAVTTGVSDSPLFGAPVFAEILSGSPRLLAPSARLVFEATESGSVGETIGSLRFLWVIGALEACPVRWRVSTVALRPCARFEAGALQASPADVPGGQTATRPWVSLGAVARAAWEPVPWGFVEIEAGARVPFLRDQFVVLPGTTVYRVPQGSFLAEAGAGLHFP